MEQRTLKNMILNELELQQRGYAEELAKIAGYSNGANFKRTLKDHDKDIEKLDGFVRVVKMLFPENYRQLIFNFATSLNPDRITARLFLEYSFLYHLDDLKTAMIELLKKSSKSDTKEWVYAYEIDQKISVKEIGIMEGINLLSSKKYSKPEAKVYSKIAQIYAYYDMGNVYMLDFLLDEIDKDIKLIKNGFLKKSFEGRVFRLRVDINLHTDKLGELLQSGFNLEEALEPTKAATYLQIGNSFMFKSYDKAMDYYSKALEFATEKLYRETVKSINFVSLLWDKPQDYIGDQSNELFYYIKMGNKSEAKRTLEKMDLDNMTDYAKGFNFYYQGLLFNDKMMFYKSIESFNKVGEKFYKQLPLMELKKLGENPMVLMALSA